MNLRAPSLFCIRVTHSIHVCQPKHALNPNPDPASQYLKFFIEKNFKASCTTRVIFAHQTGLDQASERAGKLSLLLGKWRQVPHTRLHRFSFSLFQLFLFLRFYKNIPNQLPSLSPSSTKKKQISRRITVCCYLGLHIVNDAFGRKLALIHVAGRHILPSVS